MVSELQERSMKFLEDKNPVIVSNRGPVEFFRKDGKIVMKRGAGGLVSTLLPVVERFSGVWVSSAMTPEDAEVAAGYPENRVPLPEDDPRFTVSFVIVDRERYESYYSVISNPLLWFVQHYMWNTPYSPEIDDKIYAAWDEGYVHVNRKFAEKVVSEIERNEKNPLIMLQDYHLYLCPGFIKKKVGDVFLSQFIHIPWPQRDYFRILPEKMRESIINGLLSNTVLGFHIKRYCSNFMECCGDLGYDVDAKDGVVLNGDEKTVVRNYPISVDPDSIRRTAKSDAFREKEDFVRKLKGDMFLIYRTDRADLSKNIIRGFKAYELFLRERPEFHGKVKFLATGKPTRQQIKEYRDYTDAVKSTVDEINRKYGNSSWKPIEYIHRADYELVAAAFKNYDCLIVNPIADGMNIVPKEAALMNEKSGTVILSEHAGCYEELAEYVIGVNPFDIKETADAIYMSITMNSDERKRLSDDLKLKVSERTIYHWINEQFDDFERLMK